MKRFWLNPFSVPAILGLAMATQVVHAQFEEAGAATAQQQGEDLGFLLQTLSGDLSDSTRTERCSGLFEADTTLQGVECLLAGITQGFVVEEQWDVLENLFLSRVAAGPVSQQVSDILQRLRMNGEVAKQAEEFVSNGEPAQDPIQTSEPSGQADPDTTEQIAPLEPQRVAFSELHLAFDCPAFRQSSPLLPTDVSLTWQATPTGLRDLSPPQRRADTDEIRLLREALAFPEFLDVLTQTSCIGLRLNLSRALLRSLLGFGRVDEARQLAELQFMPRRYSRQIMGAMKDAEAQNFAKQAAIEDLLARQQILSEPGQASSEIAILMTEIERQFDVDFLLGRLWAMDGADLSDLSEDTRFIGEVGRLLSQDAKLLQQGYDELEVRYFHSDFFEVLVAKEAFDLMDAIDLLVPNVMASKFDLARASAPIRPHTPTAFEQDQEILALLISSQELEAVEGVWGELDAPQRRDAVLFALDQGVIAAAQRLYELLDDDDLNNDFLIRLSLYRAVQLAEGEMGNEIEIEFEDLVVEENS